ncbi:hypothetical protein OQA88_2543, partial [Cercophora sp. LCS_1]
KPDPTDEASDAESSTASITSSILNYRQLHGRTFHGERGTANYWAANDAKQNDLLDIVHAFNTLHLDGGLYAAPIKDINPKVKVLDIGTGTGIWAIDFAEEFPDCQVIGTDVSPIQPSWVPPNVKFEIEDATQPWTYPANSFDYVHIRWLIGSVPSWEALFAEAFRVLKPGGYLETWEPADRIYADDGSVKPDDALGQWAVLFREGGKKIGRSFNLYDGDVQGQSMRSAGFEEVGRRDFTTPVGQWPRDPKLKEIGMFAQAAFEVDTEGYILFLATTIGWKMEEVKAYVQQAIRELRSRTRRPQYRQRVVWGRKPE